MIEGIEIGIFVFPDHNIPNHEDMEGIYHMPGKGRIRNSIRFYFLLNIYWI